MKEPSTVFDALSLTELEDMASQQQAQIDSQEQLLVVREQRLKFLKQQENQSSALLTENEKLNKLQSQVEAQEMKLLKLRALRTQVEQQKINNSSLSSDLESIRALFNEKEKELAVAVAKVEELTRQIEDVRRSRLMKTHLHTSPAALELDRLRRELIYRKKLNEQQQNKIASQRDTLNQKNEERVRVDKRIAELQERLQRKRNMNQQMVNQINSATAAKQAQIRLQNNQNRAKMFASETFINAHQVDNFNNNNQTHDDIHIANQENDNRFLPNKGDPKYQTLPYNTKFSHSTGQLTQQNQVTTQTVHSTPTFVPAKGHATAVEEPQSNANMVKTGVPLPQHLINVTPRPFGSPNINSVLSSADRGQPVGEPAPTENSQMLQKDGEPSAMDISSNVPPTKPLLPPKPRLPLKPLPPPRQIHMSSLDTSPESVDSAINVLIGNYQQPAATKRYSPYGPRGVASITGFTKEGQLSDNNQKSSSVENLPKLDLPIKPKILTIKKNLPQEHPKVKSASGSFPKKEGEAIQVTVNRHVEPPPDQLFPEKVEVVETGDEEEMSPDFLDEVDRQDFAILKEDVFSINYDVEKGEIFEKKSPDTDSIITPEFDMSPLDPTIPSTRKGNLKSKGSAKHSRRVSFDPLALLLDAALEGELELVKKTAQEVPNPSAANDEGITALHNAICAGHFEIVQFLVEFGCDVNAQDSDGWTPLHCAASCNNLPMVRFLVDHGACIFAVTLSDHETAAEKCEEDEDGFDSCSEYLYSIQEKLGIMNSGVVYAVYEYHAQNPDELSFQDGESIVVLRKGDEYEREWWWSRINDLEGYVPRNLLGLFPRVFASKLEQP